jgi:hypothetical protein
MKRIIYTAGIALSIAAFSSCDTDSQYSVTATIDGQSWQSTGGVNAFRGDTVILINAFSDTDPLVALEFSEFDTEGTFVLDSLHNAFGYGTGPNAYYTSSSRPGTFTITAFDSGDKNLIGTFSVVAFRGPTDSIAVTDGKFDVHYNE